MFICKKCLEKYNRSGIVISYPKKPLEQRYVNDELVGLCPTCKIMWDVANWENYCCNCGQKLDWS